MASQAKDQASILSMQNRLFMGQQQQVANNGYFEAASGGLFSNFAGDNGGFGTGGGFNFADQMAFGGGGFDGGFGNNGQFGGFIPGDPSGFGFGLPQHGSFFGQGPQPFGTAAPAGDWGQPAQPSAFGMPDPGFNQPGPAMMDNNFGPAGYPPAGLEQPPFGSQFGTGPGFVDPSWNQNPQWNNPNQDWQAGGNQQGWPQDPFAQPMNPMASGWGMPGQQPPDQYSSGFGLNMNMNMNAGMNMNMDMHMHPGMAMNPPMNPSPGPKKETAAHKKKKSANSNKVQPS